MAKPFLTYKQQIVKLRDEKNLIITDESTAIEALKQIGYFSLIGGYKDLFIDPMTRKYVNDATFEDIYRLYQFDSSLRELTFQYLAKIEQRLRQLISYSFCSQYGEQQAYYLNPASYNNIQKNQNDIRKLINILDYNANRNTEKAYLVHQRKTYHNVPLWVVAKVLTFGQLSKFYKVLNFKQQTAISKEFRNVNEHQLEVYLNLLTLFRNVCAHNERLFSFRTQRDFPDTPLHKKLRIPQKGTQYIYGKRDYFGLVIAFRYLLPATEFLTYRNSLTKLINSYLRDNNQISEHTLLNQMGIPDNWKTITRFKL